MSLSQCVVILGDTLGTLHSGVPEGKGYAHRLTKELQKHGVQVQNWSREDQTAMAWATEQLEELQGKIREISSSGTDLYILIELGMQDRVMLGDMVNEALGMLIRVVTSMDARPILMEVVPDNIDRKITEEMGAALVPACTLLVDQWRDVQMVPFTPSAEAHKEMAEAALRVLTEEMRLGVSARPGSPSRSTGSPARKTGSPARNTGSPSKAASPWDGSWYRKDNREFPHMHEVIEGTFISSPDGYQTKLNPVSNTEFFIEQDGHRVHAQLANKQIKWDDGDIWYLHDPGGPPGSLEDLMTAWEAAERAVRTTTKEKQRDELKAERRDLDEERTRLDQARDQLAQDTHIVNGRK